MVEDIPTSKDYFNIGFEYSMIAYANILGMIHLLEDYHYITDEEPDEFEEFIDETIKEYWENSKTQLMNAASLLHQGIDFLIKSKICEISPFLLLKNDPDKYPKIKSKKKVYFSDFYTQEAVKLIKIYNTFSDTKFSDDFTELYEKSRTRRNKIMHTVDTKLNLESENLLKEAIELIRYFMKSDWVEFRREYIENTPEHKLGSDSDIIDDIISQEFNTHERILNNTDFTKVYNVSKKRRFYLCPSCTHRSYIPNGPYFTAVLKPNNSSSTNLSCATCLQNFEVNREQCLDPECKSNVISIDYGTCSICQG